MRNTLEIVVGFTRDDI
ncbi:hypothetical protein NL305_27380 [Klebsiella pneumoniae]|nr:hypothetical protein [Klebsiella pneumoniae]